MKTKIWTGLRLLLGLLFTTFGLNFFFHFLPNPPLPEAAGNLIMAMIGSGYLFTLVKMTEVVGGLLLLSGIATPFALILLAPVTVNIVAFHLFLAPAGGVPAYAIALIHLYLGLSRLDWYRPLFKKGV